MDQLQALRTLLAVADHRSFIGLQTAERAASIRPATRGAIALPA